MVRSFYPYGDGSAYWGCVLWDSAHLASVQCPHDNGMQGEVAEWSNAAVLKTVVRLRGPGVRIPPSPKTTRKVPFEA